MSKRGKLVVACYDLASCRAAIAGGADAVSIPPNEHLKESILESHLFGREVYLSLEASVRQNALQNILTLVKQAYECGVTGLIVADTGVYTLLRERFSDLPIIISSRFDIRNQEGLERFPDSTVMLTPELTYEEVTHLASKSSVGLVVHANLSYLLERADTMTLRSVKKKGLSFRDICLVDDVMHMRDDNNITFFSVVAYHKSPSRIYTITSMYRSALEGEIDEHQKNELLLTSDCNVLEGLGNKTDDAINGSTKVKDGLLLGYVQGGRLTLRYPLKRGERVAMPARKKRAHFKITYLIVNGQKVTEAHEGDSVVLKYPQFLEGQPVFKTSVEPREVPQCKIPVLLHISGEAGKPLQVTAKTGEYTVQCESEKPIEEASQEHIPQERIAAQLSRIGDSPFRVEEAHTDVSQNTFIQFSQLNRLRNTLFERLKHTLCGTHFRESPQMKRLPNGKQTSYNSSSNLFVKVFTLDHVSEAIEAGADLIYFDIFSPDVMDAQYLCRKANIPLYLFTPHIIHEKERGHIQKLVAHYNPDGILAGEVSLLNACGNVHLDHTIPADNLESQKYWGLPHVVVAGDDGLSGLDPSRVILFKEGRMRFLQTRFSIPPVCVKKLRGVRYEKNPYGDIVLYKEEQDFAVDTTSAGVYAVYLELDTKVHERISEYKAALQSSVKMH